MALQSITMKLKVAYQLQRLKMYEIFSEIDLSQYELYINAGGNNSLIIGLLEGMLVANSRKSSDLHGLIGANPLGELASKRAVAIQLKFNVR